MNLNARPFGSRVRQHLAVYIWQRGKDAHTHYARQKKKSKFYCTGVLLTVRGYRVGLLAAQMWEPVALAGRAGGTPRSLKTADLHLFERSVFLAFCRFEDVGCQPPPPPPCGVTGDKIKNKIRYQHVCQLSTIPSVLTDKTRLASELRSFHEA